MLEPTATTDKQNIVHSSPEQETAEKKKRGLLALLSKKTAGKVSKRELIARAAFLTALGLVVLMAILYALSALFSFRGWFTIRVIRPAGMDRRTKIMSLSETPGFANPTVLLKGIPVDDMDNITYEWLPLDQLDAYDGSHNGKNYVAYTFYISNVGEEPLDYVGSLEIVRRTLKVDHAVRIMVYRNGEAQIYARKAADGRVEKVPVGVQNFLSDDCIAEYNVKDFKPGEQDRYTVVAWLEGEDPECIDDIRGSFMQMEMNFCVLDEDGNPHPTMPSH